MKNALNLLKYVPIILFLAKELPEFIAYVQGIVEDVKQLLEADNKTVRPLRTREDLNSND
jgi:hypothetical protein